MSITPLRRQYLKIKQRYPQTIVFFRLGDFYETFDDDAKTTARELEITLTSREMGKGQRVPMAGIPYHALDNYLAKLIGKGYKVAICEQLSPPGKGLVERDVIRVVTPGTVVEPGLLNDKSNNYLVSLVSDGDEAGISYVDITTGEFATTQLPTGQVSDELERLHPAELLLPESFDAGSLALPVSVTRLDDYWFDLETAEQTLIDHFGVASLEGYGCAHLPLAVGAAGAIIRYLQESQKAALGQLDQMATYSTQSFMVLDAHTRHNLELFASARWGAGSGSLLSVIDLTETSMGGRLLKKWLGQPLLDIKQLTGRQDAVAWFYDNTMVRHKVMSLLGNIADLERLVNRVRSSIATPRDLVALRYSLEKLAEVKAEIEGNEGFPAWLSSELKPCPDVVGLVEQAIVDEPGATLERGGVVRAGFSQELDEIRQAASEAKRYLANLERQEKERTGIKALKVGYNRVFGYYIEVSKSNLSMVPDSYIRKQTLTGGERFFTPELKEYESIILNAQERIVELETAIFRQVCQQIAGVGEQILSSAKALAEIDVFAGLAEAAVRYRYIRPDLAAEDAVTIKGGRHPVVEKNLGSDGFIPNDTYLCNKDTQLIILTGPNMAGKSTYLKQVALIVLLAQIGSFVPAEAATIGVVDRIFTRIGAQEDLAAGQSTFMVEMVEAANILNNATPKSLIILDEIGRGTSTYDGLSIAWAVAEFIHNHPRLRAKTLFATHYHELVEMAGFLPRVKNFNVAVAEEEGKVIFLRKVVPGGADKSYGIHVAQLAGLPASVVHRAEEVLAGLENGQPQQKKRKAVRPKKESPPQLAMFGDKSPLIEEISQLDIDSMSPLEAITRLYELKRKAKEAGSKP
ncbi:MAG: DNA mismatch repair protein MutS [Chloroflexi bacterium RBG_13_50_10]|nr:MAG: DNA mismatch repair protein MutS [Chloroflexi bacterium RBG_13_50_10]